VTRLPSSPIRPQPRQTSRLRPPTYTAAVYVLGAVLLLEFASVVSVFWMRAMVVPVNFQVPKSHPGALATTPETTVQPGALPTATPPGELPNLNVSGQRGLLALPGASDSETQIGNFLAQVKLLRGQNDSKGALNLLIQAEDVDPRNPDVLQAMAEVYYLLNDAVRSKIYWQRLVDLGPAVGRPYTQARDHVLLLESSPDADTLESPSLLPRTVFIDSVEKTPVETIDGTPQFQVRTSLMRKDPNMPNFDQKKLQPFVIFYQQLPDGTLTPDLRPHKGAFDDTFLFWNKKPKEPFTVDYTMPITDSTATDGKPQGKYYGFVIGIYYDKTLQDVRSEPADLITRLPLPDAIE
jgi:hypothetical protein